MSKDDRSVIERLDDIEKKIAVSKQQKPKPISKTIGRPFADYLNDATVYGIEDDLRKFKKTIKTKKTTPAVTFSILILILVFDIVSLFVNKQLEWLMVIATFLSILPVILSLIVLSKQKNKQPMRSFWNVTNTEFYLTNDGGSNKIVKEESRGAIYYVLVVSKLIATVISFGFALWYLLFSAQSKTSTALNWIVLAFGYLTFIINSTYVWVREPYHFFNYIFETEDSYVTYPNLDYFKK